jgi:signal transduction histidine kinase
VVSGFASVLLAKTLRSSTLRLALICIAVFGAVVIALFGYVYWATASYLQSRTDQAIAAELATLQSAFATGGRGELIAAIAQHTAAPRSDGGVYLLADAGLAPLAGNLDGWPSELRGAVGWSTFRSPQRRPDAGSAPQVRATYTTLPDGSHLVVGRNIADLDQFVRRINIALGAGIVLIFVLAGVASLSVTRRTVGRIEAINATSRAIMQSGLGQRIPRRGTHDEWDELAANLNSMLERIELLMNEVKQVTDNVAHDLRTPLTRIRGRLERAYARSGSGAADANLIADTLADLDAVLAMFTSLTRISQIEANARTAAFHTLDIAELAREVAELFDAAAEERGGRLEVVGDDHVLVTGDRDLLFDALANLVDNAIKHGRDGGRVAIEVALNGGAPTVSITDDGPGIPLAERERVLKRFYRLERSRRMPGNGLGLSLVAAVARLHGAVIEMHDNAPGLAVRLVFPPTAQSDANGMPVKTRAADRQPSSAIAPSSAQT